MTASEQARQWGLCKLVVPPTVSITWEDYPRVGPANGTLLYIAKGEHLATVAIYKSGDLEFEITDAIQERICDGGKRLVESGEELTLLLDDLFRRIPDKTASTAS